MRNFNKIIGYTLFAIFSIGGAFMVRKVAVFSYGNVVGNIVFIVSLTIIGFLIWSGYTGRYARIMKKLSQPISLSWDSDDDAILENMSEQPSIEKEEKQGVGRPKNIKKPLYEWISQGFSDKTDFIVSKVEDYLSDEQGQYDIALLYFALRKLKYIDRKCKPAEFRDALEIQYRGVIDIIGGKGVCDAINALNEIVDGKRIKDLSENKNKIHNIVIFLSN